MYFFKKQEISNNFAGNTVSSTEITQVIVDLKKVLQSLSAVTNRLEKCLSQQNLNEDEEEVSYQSAEEDVNFNPVPVSKRINAFQKQSKEFENIYKTPPTPKLRSSQSVVERPKEIKRQNSVKTEAINQTVVNTVTNSRNSVKIKDIKNKFEFNSTSSETGSDDRDVEPENPISKIKVNVQSLKQKFETETPTFGNTTAVEINRRKSVEENKTKDNEKRRKSEGRPINEETVVEDDKVKRILKYFQPISK